MKRAQESDTTQHDEYDFLPVGKRKITVHRNGIWIRHLLHILAAVALVVQTGASPTAATEQPLTLTAGLDGTIPFECSNDHQSDMPKYYTVTIEGKGRPFYRDGALDPEGLMSPDQFERFTVVYDENDSLMSIEIHIASVSVEDQGTYIVMVIMPGEIPKRRLMKQVVMINMYIPPGPAACFLMPGQSNIKTYEVHCHSKPGNGDSTLTCFQNDDRIPYQGGSDQIVSRRAFWLMDTSAPVSCCAHDIKEIPTITEALCNQFQWSQTQVITNPDQTEQNPTEMTMTTGPLSQIKKRKEKQEKKRKEKKRKAKQARERERKKERKIKKLQKEKIRTIYKMKSLGQLFRDYERRGKDVSNGQ